MVRILPTILLIIYGIVYDPENALYFDTLAKYFLNTYKYIIIHIIIVILGITVFTNFRWYQYSLIKYCGITKYCPGLVHSDIVSYVLDLCLILKIYQLAIASKNILNTLLV